MVYQSHPTGWLLCYQGLEGQGVNGSPVGFQSLPRPSPQARIEPLMVYQSHPQGWLHCLSGARRAGSEWKPSGLPEPAPTEPAGENRAPDGVPKEKRLSAFFFWYTINEVATPVAASHHQAATPPTSLARSATSPAHEARHHSPILSSPPISRWPSARALRRGRTAGRR